MKEKDLKKINKALENLNSESQEDIKNAISTIKSYGNENTLELLILKLRDKNLSSYAKKEIVELLNSLKLNGVQNEMIRLINSQKDYDLKKLLLSTCWNSNVDYSNFLEDIVKLAIKDDYLITLECLSIIENMQGPFNEEQILESKVIIKKYFDKENNVSEKKNILIKTIFDNIENFDKLSE